jgi:hypothetical protein
MLFRLLAFKSFSLFQVIAFKRAIRVWEVKPQPFQPGLTNRSVYPAWVICFGRFVA